MKIKNIFWGLLIIICILFLRYGFYMNNMNHNIDYKKYILSQPMTLEKDFHFNSIEASLIEQGKNIMKNKTVIFTGLCRDIEHSIPLMLKFIRKAGGLFADYKIVLYENDSKDNTGNILKNVSDVILLQEKLNIELAVTHGEHSINRFKKMSYFRNKCLEKIKTMNADYVIVIDMDLLGGFSIDGLCSSFGYLKYSKWDIMGANGINYINYQKDLSLLFADKYYYDPLAYRDEKYRRVKGHCVDSCGFTCDRPIFDVKIPDLIPVTSCFGGMVIYDYDVFVSGKYEGYDCEHICFHDNIIKANPNLRMFVNSQMILLR